MSELIKTRLDHSHRNESISLLIKLFSLRSVKFLIVCTKGMIFQPTFSVKALSISKMTGLAGQF